MELPPEVELLELRRRPKVDVGIQRKRSDPLASLQHVLQHVIGAELVARIARYPIELTKDLAVLEPEEPSEPARLSRWPVLDVNRSHEISARLDIGMTASEGALQERRFEGEDDGIRLRALEVCRERGRVPKTERIARGQEEVRMAPQDSARLLEGLELAARRWPDADDSPAGHRLRVDQVADRVVDDEGVGLAAKAPRDVRIHRLAVRDPDQGLRHRAEFPHPGSGATHPAPLRRPSPQRPLPHP